VPPIDAQTQSDAGAPKSLLILAALLALAYAGAQFPGPFAFLDNLSNFPAHFAAAFLACAGLLAFFGRRAIAVGCLALTGVATAQVAPWYFGADDGPVDPARPTVRLLVANVYFANRDRDRIQRLVAAEDPDVVGLIEVSRRFLRGIAPLRERYPHHFEVPNEEYVGLALYSRLPLRDARVLRLPGEDSSPAIAATLEAPGGDVELLLVHPMSPVSAPFLRKRNEQIEALARYAGKARGPLVMAGDFNLTMWNDGYRPLVEAAGLHNARKGHGIGATWPAVGPGVPIDHVLATPEVRLRNFRVLSRIGSDHLPVFTEFSIR
jgi:endonuclease/exonuclease/phosphatase (EEP) superfamily protein YafD